MPKIDTIVFDLGGVLIDWNPRYLYRQLSNDPVKIERFLTEVCDSEWNSKQDAGRPFALAIEELARQFPNEREWIHAYWDRWSEMISGEIAGTVKILESLAKKRTYRLIALTNWSNETFPCALKRFDFFKLFEGIVVSGDEKTIKPSPELFEIMIERFQLDPKQCVFIDDVEKNVTTAASLGFRALQFSTPEALISQLEALSISV